MKGADFLYDRRARAREHSRVLLAAPVGAAPESTGACHCGAPRTMGDDGWMPGMSRWMPNVHVNIGETAGETAGETKENDA